MSRLHRKFHVRHVLRSRGGGAIESHDTCHTRRIPGERADSQLCFTMVYSLKWIMCFVTAEAVCVLVCSMIASNDRAGVGGLST